MSYIKLVRFEEKYIEDIWNISYRDENPEWSKWNGPYFEDYTQYQDLESFRNSEDWKFLLKENCRCILIDEKPVGMVSRNWKDEKTRWMEIGIVIYDENYWSHGYGTSVMKLWTTKTFQDYENIEHLGLTTWSGNVRMMKAAEKMGFQKEAQIRKVRYWKGVYYDSVKYGVLRDEWEKLSKKH